MKFGQHMDLSLPGYQTPQQYLQLAQDIFGSPDSIVTEFPKDAPLYPGETHFELDGNLLRLDPLGNFRSLYPTE